MQSPGSRGRPFCRMAVLFRTWRRRRDARRCRWRSGSKAQRILHLGAGLDVGAQAAQERAGLFLVHTVAEARQVIVAFCAFFPDLIAEKAVRAVGTGRERRRALDFVMDRHRRFCGGAHMGIAFRHRDSPFVGERRKYCNAGRGKCQICGASATHPTNFIIFYLLFFIFLDFPSHHSSSSWAARRNTAQHRQ